MEVKAVGFNYSTYLSYALFTCPLTVIIIDIQRLPMWAGETAQPIKCLSCKIEDLNLIQEPTSQSRVAMLATPELGTWRQAGLRDLMASQPS